MKTKHIITNKKLYNERVVDVDTSGLIGYNGTIAIETMDGDKTITGEHGVIDYEKEFGFILRIVMKRTFYIIDNTSNSPSIGFVLDESGEIIHTEENCINFPTQEQANDLIKKKGWESWAGVVEY